ncbi:hypothetical protein ACFVXC_25910 [Streptomyces sp. NPDC058257]|uniref:hypothetical protein n=1 Tax=Streptomyces sp. NPDC058257 TaxID=3346409 RepID=UPI0036E6D481
MFEYEMHQLRAADLAREADRRRLLREAREAKATRAERRSARHDTEGRVSRAQRRISFSRAV